MEPSVYRGKKTVDVPGFCGKCGKEIDDEAVVCVHCGCPVTSQSSQEAKAETQGLSDKQKKIIAFAVVILAGLLAAFWFFVESYDPTSGYEEEQKLKQEEIERLSPLTDDLSKSTEELEKKAEELLAEAGSMDY